jgi:NAD(P)-dependent dehydrogenase (short-subunit alcohol dehydrogenase family)
MDLQLTNKQSLVTGSTAGIGFAIAEVLSSEGATVIINGRTQSSVDAAMAKLVPTAKGELFGFAGNLSESDVTAQLVRQHPDVEILINNLGIYEPMPFEEITDEDWRRFFEVNVLSGVRLCRHYLPAMRARNWGRIIFISSESGIQIPAEMIHYGMSKTAQLAISRGLAETVAGTQITVNSILPGPTRSRGVSNFVEELAKQEGKPVESFEQSFVAEARPTSLIKRFATPREVATLVAYVASPLSSATTGSALRVDGGVVKTAF